jgi:predicted TIM-barrel fold metal-dependent hydrolase
VTSTAPTSPSSRSAVVGTIDCDLHNAVPNVEALFPYLPRYWVEHVNQSVFKGVAETYYPKNAPVTAREGSRPEGGGPAGSDLSLIQQQVLDPLGIAVGILNCLYAIDSLHNPDAAISFAQAVNDWQVAEWLEKDSRLRASIVVPSQLPAEAAKEVDRAARLHPGFVQVGLPIRSQHPYGSRLFHPMWEAIERNGLVAGLHYGGAPGNPPTPSGWTSYFVEDWVGMAQVFQSQVCSIISEGVFDKFPSQRVTLIESGFTWIPAFMWRFDKEWKNLRRLVPWVRRAPSEYMREHMRVTLQPVDSPPTLAELLDVIDQMGSDQMILYATDYPHRHAVDPEADLLPEFPAELARKIRSENARKHYRL